MHLAPLHTSLCHPALVQHSCASCTVAAYYLYTVLRFLHCSSLCYSICIRLYPHPPVLLLLIEASVARSNPSSWVPRGSCPSSLVVHLTTTRCLPTSAQVVSVHSWHSHHLSPLPSLPLLAQPWSRRPLPCSSSLDNGSHNDPTPHSESI